MWLRLFYSYMQLRSQLFYGQVRTTFFSVLFGVLDPFFRPPIYVLLLPNLFLSRFDPLHPHCSFYSSIHLVCDPLYSILVVEIPCAFPITWSIPYALIYLCTFYFLEELVVLHNIYYHLPLFICICISTMRSLGFRHYTSLVLTYHTLKLSV